MYILSYTCNTWKIKILLSLIILTNTSNIISTRLRKYSLQFCSVEIDEHKQVNIGVAEWSHLQMDHQIPQNLCISMIYGGNLFSTKWKAKCGIWFSMSRWLHSKKCPKVAVMVCKCNLRHLDGKKTHQLPVFWKWWREKLFGN